MPVDKFGRMSDTKNKDTGVSLTYINNNYIRSDGTTPVSGSINMNGNTLFNLPNPENPHDVATKDYVDNNKRKHIIAVSANYSGELIKDAYQFSFGGHKSKDTGFLIPHSGRIKKIKFSVHGNYSLIDGERSYFDPVYAEFFFQIVLFKKMTFDDVEKPVLLFGETVPFETIPFFEEKILATFSCKVVSRNKYVSDGYRYYDEEGNPIALGGKEFLDESVRALCLSHDVDLTNYPLAEGEYINIKSKTGFKYYCPDYYSKYGFLFTFLIELDPL